MGLTRYEVVFTEPPSYPSFGWRWQVRWCPTPPPAKCRSTIPGMQHPMGGLRLEHLRSAHSFVDATHMDSAAIIQRLKRDRWTLARVRGSHQQFTHPDGGRVTVPHPRKDIPTGTLRNIDRQAGWPWRGEGGR